MEASSIQTSLSITFAKTTTAKAQPSKKAAPCGLQAASFFNISLSSTTTNCHGFFLFEAGAINPAFRIAATWSGFNSWLVNFRVLLLSLINDAKSFISFCFMYYGEAKII